MKKEERKILIEKAANHPRLKQFIHTTYPWSCYEFFKRFVFPGPLFFVLRLLMVMLSFSLLVFFEWVVFIGFKDWEKPARFRRKLSFWVIHIFTRCMLFFSGFHWIQYIDHTKKMPKSNKAEDLPKYQIDQPWPSVAPHATPFDIVTHSWLAAPSFAAKEDTLSIPMVAYLLKVMRCIIIFRDKNKNKNNDSSFQTMQDRIRNPCKGEYTPLVFAEGTTNNGCYLLRFHTGAFLAGKPIRPIVTSYPSTRKSINWESVTFFELLYDMFTQYHNRVKIEILSLYIPSDEEKKDAQLYADNVGKLIAKTMNIQYAPEVDYEEKKVYLALIRGTLKWEDVDGALKKIDDGRKEAAGKKKEWEDENLLMEIIKEKGEEEGERGRSCLWNPLKKEEEKVGREGESLFMDIV